MKTLKSMDVSPVVCLMVADYLVSQCAIARPTEEDIVRQLEAGVKEFGSASAMVSELYVMFGPSHVPGSHLAKSLESTLKLTPYEAMLNKIDGPGKYEMDGIMTRDEYVNLRYRLDDGLVAKVIADRYTNRSHVTIRRKGSLING